MQKGKYIQTRKTTELHERPILHVEKQRPLRSVGLVIRHNVLKSLKSFDPISDRILRAEFLTDKEILNVTVG